jgi:hypothetical protein
VPENVIADTDSDMSEDRSVNAVESVTTGKTVKQVIAEIDAAIEEIYD